jgi:hypothetical protein
MAAATTGSSLKICPSRCDAAVGREHDAALQVALRDHLKQRGSRLAGKWEVSDVRGKAERRNTGVRDD